MDALKIDSVAWPLLPRVIHFVQEKSLISAWPGCFNLIAGLVLSIAISVCLKLFQNYYYSPLKSFPGPFCTNFTDLWRYVKTAGGSAHLVHAELHRKYGPAVRVGPNVLSLSDPALIKLVYNTKSPWKKVSSLFKLLASLVPNYH